MFPLFNFTRAVLRRVGSELDMAERKSVALHVRELVAPTADELGLKLWDVEYVKEGADYVLRITIDSDEGITIDDCERFHRAIDPVIDEDDPIENSYKLEVSSPGVERVLTRPEHFEEFLPDYKNLEELEDHYRRGGLGDVKDTATETLSRRRTARTLFSRRQPSPRCRPYLNGKRRISEKQKITTKITKGKIYTRYKSQQVKPDECRIL